MSADIIVERLFETLVAGDRPATRELVNEQHAKGATPETLVCDLYWPTHELIEKLHREDQITPLAYGMATRLLRAIVDQTASALIRTSNNPPRNKSVMAFCAGSEGGDLGAQMATDILEASGFNVRFAGGGVPVDEIRAAVQSDHPDHLVLFCSDPADLPDIRNLIDTLRTNHACDSTQVVVGGGVFNRAEGLAEEIGADLWAEDPMELAHAIIHEPERRAPEDQRTVGRTRPVAKAA